MAGIANLLKLDAARAAYTALGEDIFAGDRSALNPIFTRVVPCDGTSLEIDAMGATPAVQEIVGDRRWGSLRAYVNRARVKRYGPDGLVIPVLEILADKNDLIAQQLAAYVRDNASYYEKPLFDLLLSNPTCIDGGALYSGTHSFGANGGTWDNLGAALSPSEFFTGIATMEALQLENGEPAGYFPTDIMGGPLNRKMILDLVSQDRIVPVAATGLEAYASAVAAATRSNFAAETPIKPTIANRITGSGFDASWFFFDTRREMARPIVIGEAIAPQTYSIVDGSSPYMITASNCVFYAESQAALLGSVPLSTYGYIA